MFESLTITTILFILFFFWQNKRLGLTAEVPLDPKDRVHYFASECLSTLKNLLPQCRVQEIRANQLTFVQRESSLEQKIFVKDGVLMMNDQRLNELGEKGQVHFEKPSDSALLVTVEANTGTAEHRLSVRLEVRYA